MVDSPEDPAPKKSRRLSLTTIVILILAAVAGVTYYLGTPAIAPSLTPSTNCARAVHIIVGNNTNFNYEQPSLTIVVGVNNTVAWTDDESGFELHIITTAVPSSTGNWDLNMTQGQTECLTPTSPGMYVYYYLNVQTPPRTLIVKQA